MTNYSAQGIVLVKRKPATADEAVLKQQITLVAKEGASALKISDLGQLVADLNRAGIIVAEDTIYLKAKQTLVRNNDNQDIAVFNDDGSFNANLINAKQIVADGLKANTFDAGNATINNLIVTNAQVAGKITATSGKIGYFNINANGMITYGDAYADGDANRDFGLSNNCIYFTHKTGTTRDAVMWLGRTIQGLSPQVFTDLWIDEEETTPTHSKACLHLTAKGYTGEESNYANELCGNFAIYSVDGMYAGFRPAARTITKGMTLTDMDCFLFCTNNSAITLTLPSSPKKGQMYIIYQAYARVYFTSTKKIVTHGHDWIDGGVTTWDSNSRNQLSFFIYTGKYWMINYIVH